MHARGTIPNMFMFGDVIPSRRLEFIGRGKDIWVAICGEMLLDRRNNNRKIVTEGCQLVKLVEEFLSSRPPLLLVDAEP